MMKKNYSKYLKNKLFHMIDEMEKNPTPFVNKPGKDFSRKRKLNFSTFIHLSLSMESGSTRKELLKYFEFKPNVITPSAYVQQRAKVSPNAFEHLFHEFTTCTSSKKTLKGYRLLAGDGSNISIPANPNDPDNYTKKKNERAYGRCHLNAFYDVYNRVYVDALIQKCRKANENQALVDMIDRSNISGKVILLADRGYESYNVMAHLNEKNWNYVIRIKDSTNKGGIACGFELPEGSFDVDISRELVRSQRVIHTNHPERYKSIYHSTTFDYLAIGDHESTYPLSFRIVRFPLKDGKYETVITNLDRIEFPEKEIKDLYQKRWGIESSFRELKYSVGLSNFRSRKSSFIEQEIFARLIVFNFCESIVAHIMIKKEENTTKHIYQCNILNAIDVCKHFLSNKNKKMTYLEELILASLNPIRPGRSSPRLLRARPNVSFTYRISQ